MLKEGGWPRGRAFAEVRRLPDQGPDGRGPETRKSRKTGVQAFSLRAFDGKPEACATLKRTFRSRLLSEDVPKVAVEREWRFARVVECRQQDADDWLARPPTSAIPIRHLGGQDARAPRIHRTSVQPRRRPSGGAVTIFGTGICTVRGAVPAGLTEGRLQRGMGHIGRMGRMGLRRTR